MAKVSKDDAITKINEGNGDFHLYSDEEHKAFLDNLKDTEIFKQQLDGRIAEVHKQYDDDLYAVLGKKRGQDQKTYDFLKTEITTLSQTAKELQDKNQELEKAVKDKSGDETINLLRGENETLQKKYQKAKEEWDQKLSEREGEFQRMKVSTELDRSLAGIKFKDIPEDVRNMAIQTVKSELVNASEYDDGKLVFKGQDGKILRDESTMIPLTGADLMKAKLKSIIDEGHTQTGVKVDPDIKEKDGKLDVDLGALPVEVNSKPALDQFLIDKGFRRGSKEYLAAYKKYSKDL